MLKIWKNNNANVLLYGAFILLFLVVVMIPLGQAQYVTQAEISHHARVAKFDVEVIAPSEWVLEEANEIVFTKRGNLESVDVPFKIINNSEVKVYCTISSYQAQLDMTIPLAEGYVDVNDDKEFYAQIPEEDVGESVFELIILVEQVD